MAFGITTPASTSSLSKIDSFLKCKRHALVSSEAVVVDKVDGR